MKNLILSLVLVSMVLSGCAALNNTTTHQPIYMNKSLSFEVRRQYLLADMYREVAPWPL